MAERDSTPVTKPGKPNSAATTRKSKSGNTTPATTPAKKKRETPKKPHKDFLLFPHASGQLAKKVRGKLLYFGSDSKTALDRWIREMDDLLVGRTPRVFDANALTVKRLCDLFLESRESEQSSTMQAKRHHRRMADQEVTKDQPATPNAPLAKKRARLSRTQQR